MAEENTEKRKVVFLTKTKKKLTLVFNLIALFLIFFVLNLSLIL